MDGQTTFLNEFYATAPDLSCEINIIIGGENKPMVEPVAVIVMDEIIMGISSTSATAEVI